MPGQDIIDVLKPGRRENEIVALASKRLYELGSDQVDGQRDLRRALQPAPAQLGPVLGSARSSAK